MLKQSWILMFLSVGITALAPAPYETDVESLKSALNAVKRKQISLEPTPQEYYNDFRSRKYHGGDVERMFEMERQNDRVLPDENEKLEFLPNETGQLEMVDDEFQGISDKMLEKSILNYLMNAQEQERVPSSSSSSSSSSSLFRERERSSNRKRANANDDIDFRERANFILEQLRNSDPSALKELEENYLDVPISEKYGMNQGKKLYENESPMSWSELFDKGDFLAGEGGRRNGEENDFADKDMEQDILYFLPTERRNVNARYPLGRQLDKYQTLGKRYPVAKRSPKEFQRMDPKVAQDLGALFGNPEGAQSALKTRNYTRAHNQEQEHEQEHEHEHENVKNNNIRIDTSEAPKVKPTSKGQKENVTKINTSNGKSIEMKKKSVDWSQYFGIDRRKKKTTLLARPDTQDQDDEWMLQRYYENMAENLKHPEEESETESNDKKDKIERMYTMLSDISMELEKERDYIMNKLAAAYSYKKIRKALDGLHNILAIQKEIQNNLTQNFRNDGSAMKNENKRTGFDAGTKEASDVNKKCPDLEKIERHCKAAYNFAGDNNQMFYFPCVTYEICKACVPPNETEEEECLTSFALETAKACDAIVKEKGIYKELQFCIDTILSSMKLQPSIGISEQCRVNRESCLRRYHSRYRHRYPSFPFYIDFLFRRGSDISQTSD